VDSLVDVLSNYKSRPNYENRGLRNFQKGYFHSPLFELSFVLVSANVFYSGVSSIKLGLYAGNQRHSTVLHSTSAKTQYNTMHRNRVGPHPSDLI